MTHTWQEPRTGTSASIWQLISSSVKCWQRDRPGGTHGTAETVSLAEHGRHSGSPAVGVSTSFTAPYWHTDTHAPHDMHFFSSTSDTEPSAMTAVRGEYLGRPAGGPVGLADSLRDVLGIVCRAAQEHAVSGRSQRDAV